ncbi:MAG: DUF2497 domain-containing protein [Novosphingobium sp.]|nr:DUF2497 domain-containing protein [Novosphingobium sp.]
MRQDSEPTVEEILESIKKVIARDNRVLADGRVPAREDPGMRETPRIAPDRAGSHEDVLDLAEAEAMADLIVDEDDEIEYTGDETGFAEFAERAEPAPLLGEQARDSMRESLAALAMLAEPGAPPQIVRSGETSLEGLARELLRPALAEWLDKNLPPLVERMVAAEIARIVGKRG